MSPEEGAINAIFNELEKAGIIACVEHDFRTGEWVCRLDFSKHDEDLKSYIFDQIKEVFTP